MRDPYSENLSSEISRSGAETSRLWLYFAVHLAIFVIAGCVASALITPFEVQALFTMWAFVVTIHGFSVLLYSMNQGKKRRIAAHELAQIKRTGHPATMLASDGSVLDVVDDPGRMPDFDEKPKRTPH
jgi:hypothetical protein